ncbi:MAG TPA: hypothetical protein VGQ99_05610 [Tepidisphaeraceae bacterium]|nr:hypothetical protein [Tepidisphaeraceae bacterium]
MRRFQIKLTPLLLLGMMLSAARGEDAFYRVGVSELKIIEGELPAVPRSGGPQWGVGLNTMAPYARLEGAGEVYVDFRADWPLPARGPLAFLNTMLVRAEKGKELRGILYLPKSDWSGMTAVRFEIPAGKAKAEARKDFYEEKRAHYARLVESGVPGGAWFRHEMEAAAKELEQEVKAEARPGRRVDDLGKTFGLFSGGQAVAENLALERVLKPAGEGQRDTIKVSAMRGIEVKGIEWGPYIKDAKPALDPLAELIPEDQHALFIPTFDAAMALMAEGDAIAGAALPMAESRGEDAQVLARYQRQMGLSAGALAKLVGPKVIGSIAVTGSDPYLRVGSDVAVIFEAKDVGTLKKLLSAQVAMAANGVTDVKTSAGAIDGIEYSGVVSPDRKICSYLMEIGPAVVVSNSLAQLERLVEVKKARLGSLWALPEYRFFRNRYARGQAEETGLLIISDATIRRWCSPRWRIADSRRTRAAAVMSAVGMDHLDERLQGKSAKIASKWADGGELTLENGLVRSSIYGAMEFMTPIVELEMERVSEDEALAYQNWREEYEGRWRGFFDPIAMRITAQPQRLGVDLTVMPLIGGTQYRDFVNISRGAKIGPTDGDPHGAMVQLVVAINKESTELKSMAGWLEEFAKPLKLDALGWMGDSLAVYFDDDAYWNDLIKAGGSEEFQRKNLGRLPMGINIESAGGLKLTAFLAAFRRVVDKIVPETTVWEVVPHKVQPYGKISLSDKGKKDWHMLDDSVGDWAIYYTALPDALVISMSEEVIQRALLRSETRTTDRLQGKKQGPATRPYLGPHLAAQIEGTFIEKMGLAIWPQYSNEMAAVAWGNIPILNEWKRMYPQENPVGLHERLFGVKLIGPDGSSYVWNETWGTMESVSYGCPGDPKTGPNVPKALMGLKFISGGVDFEKEGLRGRVLMERPK